MEGVNRFTKHVLHDHVKSILVGQWCREVNLAVNGHAATGGDSIGDGVHDHAARITNGDFDIEILKESIGKDTVVDFHRVFHPITISVREHRVVE